MQFFHFQMTRVEHSTEVCALDKYLISIPAFTELSLRWLQLQPAMETLHLNLWGMLLINFL